MRSLALVSLLAACGTPHSIQPPDGAVARCTTTPTRLVTPGEIAPAELGPVGAANPFLAVDAGGVFYNETYTGVNGGADPTGHIAYKPFGGAQQILADGAHPGRFVVTATNVLFIDDSGIRGAPREMGPVFTFVPLASPASWLTTDGQQLYFDDASGVSRAPLSGGSPQQLATTSASFSAGLVDGSLIVADFSGGTLTGVSATTGATSPLAMGQLGPLYPQMCPGGGACWIDAGDAVHLASIVKLGPGAGTSTVAQDLALFDPHGMAADATDFFVTSDASGGTLSRVHAADGKVDKLAVLHGDGDVVVDDQCVYYSSFDGIFSLAKDAPAL
jgi:hypothetical protein